MGNQAEEITQSNHSLRQGRGREAQECAGSAGRGLSGEVPSPRSPAAHGAKGRKSVSRANKRKCEGPGVGGVAGRFKDLPPEIKPPSC